MGEVSSPSDVWLLVSAVSAATIATAVTLAQTCFEASVRSESLYEYTVPAATGAAAVSIFK